ncbi:MAG: hypothetical protein H0W02_13180 [Ktedonobacteraceae bacterium]|nr:hypothetical protein [Ktedonobacteraceae bacterium]
MQGAKRWLIIIGIGVAVLLVIGIIIAALTDTWLDILYVALIVLAAFTLVATGLLIVAALTLIRTITMVRDEVKPLLASVQETVGVVKDTARTAGQTVTTIGSTAQLTRDFAIAPGVQTAALLVAGQRVLSVFLGKGHVRKRSEERRQQQLEAIYEGE